MYRRACRYLTAGVVLLVCACTRDTVNPALNRPLASFRDGAHGGNPDFFFLPPIFANPVNNPNYSANAFNANVRPTVEICELVAGVCGTVIKTFAASEITLSTTNQQYQVDWNTSLSNLVLTSVYRIRVLLGTQELGFADIDPVATGGQLKNVDTGEYIGLVDGRTLPIKFRIENGAACSGGQCNSGTIDLSQGGSVVFAATGDRVDIPAQQSGQVVTLTVQSCPDLDVDIPVFGNCLRVTADPPLGATKLSPPATISMCSLTSFPLPPLHAQQDLITLHRKDDAVILSLPHSTDFCAGTIGGAANDGAGRSLAARGWRTLRRAAEWMFAPASLHATNLVFDVGAGGQSDGFSDFQFALPAQLSLGSLASQTVFPNSPVPSVPTVLVTDALGNPVADATVHFTTAGGGTIAPTAGVVTTGADGIAALTSWQLGALGDYGVQASGRGIGDPRTGVFAPPIFHDPGEDEAQTPVLLGTGAISFSALSAAPDLVVSTGTPTVAPATVTAGSTVQLSAWTILNQGNADAASGVRNGFYLSTDTIITAGDVLLDVNNNTAAVLTAGNAFNWGGPILTIPATTTPGTYYIGILVDDLGQVAEANESNNYVRVPLIVTAPVIIGSVRVP